MALPGPCACRRHEPHAMTPRSLMPRRNPSQESHGSVSTTEMSSTWRHPPSSQFMAFTTSLAISLMSSRRLIDPSPSLVSRPRRRRLRGRALCWTTHCGPRSFSESVMSQFRILGWGRFLQSALSSFFLHQHFRRNPIHVRVKGLLSFCLPGLRESHGAHSRREGAAGFGSCASWVS